MITSSILEILIDYRQGPRNYKQIKLFQIRTRTRGEIDFASNLCPVENQQTYRRKRHCSQDWYKLRRPAVEGFWSLLIRTANSLAKLFHFTLSLACIESIAYANRPRVHRTDDNLSRH